MYENLTYDELKPLLPAIHKAIVEPSPSGIMFADGIRMSGLALFSKHRVSEGIELLADYARNQKPHASEQQIAIQPIQPNSGWPASNDTYNKDLIRALNKKIAQIVNG